MDQIDRMRTSPHPVGRDGYPLYYAELRRLGTYDRFLRNLGRMYDAGNLDLRNFNLVWRVNRDNAVTALNALNLPRCEYIALSVLLTRYFEAVRIYWIGGSRTNPAGCA